MPANYVLLEKITVGAAGASSVTFSNIPQTGYTDLLLKASVRFTGGTDWFYGSFNGSSDNFTARYVQGNGATAFSSTLTTHFGLGAKNSYNANTFSSTQIYIPNYRSSNNKSISTETVQENNVTNVATHFHAQLWSNSAAITSITLAPSGDSFDANSTFYLYGVAKLGTEPAIVPYATGGSTIMTDGTYWYHAFKANGTFTPQKGLSCDVLVVAGGGGAGGDEGGGGGAGGYRLLTSNSLTTSGYTVTVGAGGTAGGVSVVGGKGGNTTFAGSGITTLSSTGGGGGASNNTTALAGGSGGGGKNSFGAGNEGGYTPAEGFAGGASNNGGGGGGGATVAGGGGSIGYGNPGWPGGSGSSTASSWGLATGTGQNVSGTVYFAGGGGAGSIGDFTHAGGAGGNGGGGRGSGNDGAQAAGTANTGGGGGAASGWGGTSNGTAGGSGIVIVRYAV
jgi:hypothetical protein